MIKVIIAGGLGNQLFQFFAGINVAKKLNINELKVSYQFFQTKKEPRNFDLLKCVDVKYIAKNFDINIKYENSITDVPLFKFGTRFPIFFCALSGIVNDKFSDFNNISDGITLVGYHHDLNKLPNRDLVAKSFMHNISDFNDGYSVHLRRGDYLLKKNNNYGLVSSYSVLELLRLKSAFDHRVIFFSDSDIKSEIINKLSNFERNNCVFASDLNLTVVDEFNLMRNSSNIVCSNSTFSWWAAFSSNLASKIYFPDRWNKHSNFPANLRFNGIETYKVDLL